jgi:hypothetical protein
MTTPQTALECARSCIIRYKLLNMMEESADPIDVEELAAIIEAHVQQRCAALVALLETAVFNANSVIANMKDARGSGGWGFDVSDEKQFIEDATAALAQFKGEV